MIRFTCMHCPPKARHLATWLSSSATPTECPECGELVAPPIALVACSARKLTREAPARDLYCSALFQASRAYAEQIGPWFVLSAKHGLVGPGQSIAPYNRELRDLSVDQQKAWALGVATALQISVAPPRRVVMLAGVPYRQYLQPILEARGYEVETPLAGLGIGYQKQRLGELVREARA